MNREQAEKKAMELLGEKEGTDLMYLTGYRSCHDKAIPIVADLLIREAELESAFKDMYRAYKDTMSRGVEKVGELQLELSASQKKETMLLSRVEELELERDKYKFTYEQYARVKKLDEKIMGKYQEELESLKQALKKLACLGNGNQYGNSDGNIIAQKALKGEVIVTESLGKAKGHKANQYECDVVTTAIHKAQKGGA